jgi:hypothetical protein
MYLELVDSILAQESLFLQVHTREHTSVFATILLAHEIAEQLFVEWILAYRDSGAHVLVKQVEATSEYQTPRYAFGHLEMKRKRLVEWYQWNLTNRPPSYYELFHDSILRGLEIFVD